MSQRRKATVRFSINSKALERAINKQMVDITEKSKKAGMQGVYNYLEHLKDFSMNFHPWNNRSGDLRDSHEVVETPKGYALRANPRSVGADYDYGGLLEFGFEKGLGNFKRDYSWIRPAHKMLKHKLPKFIAKEIKAEVRNRK